ncbi:MAG: amino acid ABC transporter permease [Nitrospinaceae bacterium]|nr:MAG: amino acid ABC transporter permease [Nitrospinaceae bacterium]
MDLDLQKIKASRKKPSTLSTSPQHWAWNIAVAGSILFLVYLPARDTFLPESAAKDYLKLLPLLPQGILYTLAVTLLGSASAIFAGLLVAFGKLSRYRGIQIAASFYTEILRGIPLLVLLFYVYYALGQYLHIPAFAAAVLGFGLCYGAYMADVFRAGIESIPKEQGEAARSLGMTERQAMFQIILPQAMRTIVPAIGNQTLGMLKDTSLVSVLAITDILRIGNEYATRHFNYFETYTYVALTYLILTLLMSRGVLTLESRMRFR